MTKRTPLLLVAALVAAALAAAACATTTAPGSPPDTAVSTLVPPASGPPPAQKPTFVDVQPGLQRVSALSWIKAVPSADGTSVALWFWGGPCMGIDHATVDDGADHVTVTLYQGTPPSMLTAVCPDLAMLQAVRIDLPSALGDRTVVDGAR